MNRGICEGKKKKRRVDLDIAKGIGILAIVLGHMGNGEINRVVYTFSVPLFFMVTGYFMSSGPLDGTFIKKRFRTLIVPYLVTALVVILGSVIQGGFQGGMKGVLNESLKMIYATVYGAGDTYSKPFFIPAIGAIWFLLANFIGSILLKMTLRMKELWQLPVVLALFVVGYWTAKVIWLPFSIQAGFCALLFMYVGYLIKKYSIFQRISGEVKRGLLVLAFLIWMMFIRNFTSFWMVHCDFGKGLPDLIGAFFAVFCVLWISKQIEMHVWILKKLLSFIGEYSLYMLCIHEVELMLFPWGKVMQFLLSKGMGESLVLWTVIGLKLILLCLFTLLFSKSKTINKIFGKSA